MTRPTEHPSAERPVTHFESHRDVLDCLPDGITIQDPDFNIVYQNRAMCQAFGPHLGEKCYAVYERRDEVCDGCGLETAFATREPTVVLRTAFEADGTTSYWENSCFALFDDHGGVYAGVEICRRVTDRVSLEADVKDRNIALGQLNRELKRKTADLTRALAERERAERTLRVEVQERRQAEEALRESEQRYRTQFEQASDAIVVAEVETGVLVDVNPAACALFGRSKADLVGRHQRELHPSEARASGFSETFEIHRAGETCQPLESRILTESGETKDVSISVSRISIHGREVLLGHFRDISAHKQAEAELAQARKLEAIGQLAAGVAHEINTPTQFVGDNIRFLDDSIASLLELQESQLELLRALKAGRSPASPIESVEKALEEADLDFLRDEIPSALHASLDGVGRIAEIVRAMKEFSHPGSSSMTPADVNRAIETTITVARNEWKYVADMVTELDPDLPPVPCVVGELNQAILNLVINAAHAIEDGIDTGGETKGTITIRTSFDDDWVSIRIVDTGKGIPEELGDRIYEPFFTTKEVGRGSGQGLAIVHNVVVKKHRGRLSYETEQGKGTTFTLRLPRRAADANGRP